MMTGRHVFYEGRVQGVGFRFTTKQIASGYEVNGWVRNLPDGRVEMQVTGDSEEIEEFLKAVENGPLGSNIRHAEVKTLDPAPELSGFRIC